MAQLVIIIQCDIVSKRCSGFMCMKTFYDRSDSFADYPPDTQYITFTCGGCCGAGVAGKLEEVQRKIKRHNMKFDSVTIHLASCIVSENYHRMACPFKEYIKKICERKGYKVVKGSYISAKTEAKRESGEYKEF